MEIGKWERVRLKNQVNTQSKMEYLIVDRQKFIYTNKYSWKLLHDFQCTRV